MLVLDTRSLYSYIELELQFFASFVPKVRENEDKKNLNKQFMEFKVKKIIIF